MSFVESTFPTDIARVPMTPLVHGRGGDVRGAAVLWMHGDHDQSNATQLADTIGRAIERSDADLVIDLSGVEFISAATYTVLLDAHLRLRERSRRFTLRAPSSCARRLLDLCDPDGVLAVVVPSPWRARSGTTGKPSTDSYRSAGRDRNRG